MRLGIWNGAAALLLAAALAGCAAQNVNPVTGKAIYTPVSVAAETVYGQKANDEMIGNYGVYKDAALTAYVDRIGQALAKNVVRKDVKYTFAILNDEGINGFALPGGFVYITRGALNFANSEAEVAAILGHEIGHVDAFHFGHTEHDSVKILLSVLLRHSSETADERALAQKLAEDSTRTAAYSQEQELEADALAVHYLALAGYDPQAVVAAIHTDGAKSALDDGAMKDNPVALDILALDQSHPATPQREARAQAAVKAEAAKNAALAPAAAPNSAAGPAGGRDAHLAAIDGMAFGDDPAEGTADGHRLVNAALGFGFQAPEDFDLWIGHGGAFGVGRKAAMAFEATDDYAGQSLVAYVQSSMMTKMTVTNVRPLEIDGYRGATGVVMAGPFAIRLGAVHDRDKRLFQFLYVAPRRAFNDLDAGFLDSVKSFHPLEGEDAKPRPAQRIHIVTVAAGDTVQSLAERMAIKEKKVEWFRVLNGLGAADAVKPGDKVKLVEVR